MKLPRLRKNRRELDYEEAVKAVTAIRNEPNFRTFVEFREIQREDVIRLLQAPKMDSDTSTFLRGQLAAIDAELDFLADA